MKQKQQTKNKRSGSARARSDQWTMDMQNRLKVPWKKIKWKLKTIISNEDSSFAEPVDFLIVDKITEFTPSSSLDISNVEIPRGFGDTRDDPVLHEKDQAIEIFKETVEFEKGRYYIVQLPFRKSYNELSDNYPIAKQRFENLWS
ncbi:DUF1758 domain-containing protein [Trichonephila clavipes]|nr:DUF1758 domain-containing protein [Trichonephila clavipes]